MIILLSPAKTMNFAQPRLKKYTRPRSLDKSALIVRTLKATSKKNIAKMMPMSEAILDRTYSDYQALDMEKAESQSLQAVLAYTGAVYTGLDAKTLSATDLNLAQNRIRIFSGLYGG